MEAGFSILPMQWSALPELAAAPALDGSELACMAVIRDVLARHGKLARFALHLAHRHFELAPGEVLIERPDEAARTQHVTVGRLEDEPGARPTTWLFDAGPAMMAAFCTCAMGDHGHTGRHVNPEAHMPIIPSKEKQQRDEWAKQPIPYVPPPPMPDQTRIRKRDG